MIKPQTCLIQRERKGENGGGLFIFTLVQEEDGVNIWALQLPATLHKTYDKNRAQ